MGTAFSRLFPGPTAEAAEAEDHAYCALPGESPTAAEGNEATTRSRLWTHLSVSDDDSDSDASHSDHSESDASGSEEDDDCGGGGVKTAVVLGHAADLSLVPGDLRRPQHLTVFSDDGVNEQVAELFRCLDDDVFDHVVLVGSDVALTVCHYLLCQPTLDQGLNPRIANPDALEDTDVWLVLDTPADTDGYATTVAGPVRDNFHYLLSQQVSEALIGPDLDVRLHVTYKRKARPVVAELRRVYSDLHAVVRVAGW